MLRIVLVALLAIFATNNFLYGQNLEPRQGANGKWGFVSETNELIIPYKYDHVDGFSERFFVGFSRVRLDGKYGFIYTTGAEVVPLRYNKSRAARKLCKYNCGNPV